MFLEGSELIIGNFQVSTRIAVFTKEHLVSSGEPAPKPTGSNYFYYAQVLDC